MTRLLFVGVSLLALTMLSGAFLTPLWADWVPCDREIKRQGSAPHFTYEILPCVGSCAVPLCREDFVTPLPGIKTYFCECGDNTSNTWCIKVYNKNAQGTILDAWCMVNVCNPSGCNGTWQALDGGWTLLTCPCP